MPNNPAALNNVGVLVTRPAHQASALCRRIQEQGGRPLLFPTVIIENIIDNPAIEAAINDLPHTHKIIFVSANAVSASAARWPTLPANLELFAIGKSTAQAMTAMGWHNIHYPDHEFNSEGLLAMPQFQQVQGQHIVIIAGEGGRDTLEHTLQRRGAKVTKIPVYRRRCPESGGEFLREGWRDGKIDVVLSTSSESLQNLYQLLGPLELNYWQQTPLIVVSERMAATARQLGYHHQLIVAQGASDDALLDALLTWNKELSDEKARNRD